MILDALVFWIRPSSSLVSKNGARWFTAKVSSIPSADSFRLVSQIPALLIRTSKRSNLSENSVAKRFTSFREERSTIMASALLLPVKLLISETTRFAFSLLLAAMITLASICARVLAVSFPIPDVAPVIRHILSFILFIVYNLSG